VNVKKIAGTASIAGALGAAALGLGAGMAQADPGPWIPPVPPVPHLDDVTGWHPVPPGQIQRVCPAHSPPGHDIGGPHGIPCT
jgi:hypothetical protein